MNEKEYQELLQKLKITGNKSLQEVMELLENIVNDYLDRQDEDTVEKINDAMEYTERLIRELGTGIAIPEEKKEESEDYESLKDGKTVDETKSDTTESKPQSLKTDSSTQGAVWFSSLNNAVGINNLFIQAKDCLKYEQYGTAERMFDDIAQVEPRNASVFLGKAMVKYKLKEPWEIESAENGIEEDVDLRKAVDFGNEQQKKFIADAIRDRKSFSIYKEAYRMMQSSKTREDWKNAYQKFESIINYKDSRQCMAQCLNGYNETVYQEAMSLLKKYENASEGLVSKVLPVFEEIRDYKDSRVRIEECRTREKENIERERVRKEKEKEQQYQVAAKKIELHMSTKDVNEAVDTLKRMPDYKDASNLLEQGKRYLENLEDIEKKEKICKDFRKQYMVEKPDMKLVRELRAEAGRLQQKSEKLFSKEELKQWDKSITGWEKRIKGQVYLGSLSEGCKLIVVVFLILLTFAMGPLSFRSDAADVVYYPSWLPLPIPAWTEEVHYDTYNDESPFPVLFSLAGIKEFHIVTYGGQGETEYTKIFPFAVKQNETEENE